MVSLIPVSIGEPGAYRFAEKGSTASFLSSSRLEDVHEVNVYGTVKFNSILHFWEFTSETQMPVRETIAKYGPECEEKIKAAIFNAASSYRKDGGLEFRWHAIVGFGQKK